MVVGFGLEKAKKGDSFQSPGRNESMFSHEFSKGKVFGFVSIAEFGEA